MTEIYLFTWNLNEEKDAHDLAVEHLSARGQQPFIACLQELPGESQIANARTDTAESDKLKAKGLAVVRLPKNEKKPRGLALVHSTDLTLEGDPKVDEDKEFLTVTLRLPSSTTTICVFGLHAKSKIDMPQPQAHGGSRALLRHSINKIRPVADHTVLLGDWNSDINSLEISSWHCFYALNRQKPLDGATYQVRRGVEHRPMYVLPPASGRATGTFEFETSDHTDYLIVDFIAFGDEQSRERSRAEILEGIGDKDLWQPSESPSILVSDHLPVAGHLKID